ncbi:MAG: hypothetical protein KDD64_11990 [Bdellovibrionales bacterium]|nr:hypothetical protein [Bdellovibrionales bacterium]
MFEQLNPNVGQNRVVSDLQRISWNRPFRVVPGEEIVSYYGDGNVVESLALRGVERGDISSRTFLCVDFEGAQGALPIDLANELAVIVRGALVDYRVAQRGSPEAQCGFIPVPFQKVAVRGLFDLETFSNVRTRRVLEFHVPFGDCVSRIHACLDSPAPPEFQFYGSTPWDSVYGFEHLQEKLFWSINDGQARRLEALLNRFRLHPDTPLSLPPTPLSYHKERTELAGRLVLPNPSLGKLIEEFAQEVGGKVVYLDESAQSFGLPEKAVLLPGKEFYMLDYAVKKDQVEVVGVLLAKGAHPETSLAIGDPSPQIRTMLAEAFEAKRQGRPYRFENPDS